MQQANVVLIDSTKKSSQGNAGQNEGPPVPMAENEVDSKNISVIVSPLVEERGVVSPAKIKYDYSLRMLDLNSGFYPNGQKTQHPPEDKGGQLQMLNPNSDFYK